MMSITIVSLLIKNTFRVAATILIFLLAVQKATGQTTTVYKIGVYEFSRRANFNSLSPKYKCEIRNLFIKNDTGWTVNKEHVAENYIRVYRGKIFEKESGRCCKESHLYYWRTFEGLSDSLTPETILTPKSPVSLTTSYLSKPFTNDDDAQLIKKASLLATNSRFHRLTTLQPYVPQEDEKQFLLDTTKTYLQSLYHAKPACTTGDNKFVFDSVITPALIATNHIDIDSSNSFIDNNGNKIIAVLFPINGFWSTVYPFESNCWQEESPRFFRILIRIDKTGKLSFLYDLLEYVDHGDFDNDSKDEYLFWYNTHHYAGYVLFYDDFKKKVEAVWNYQ